jgi:hypothetical protein
VNNLESEELDRELALNHGPAFCDVDRVKVGPRQITFFWPDNGCHEDYKGHKTRLTIEKSSCNGESLAFELQWNEFTYEKCSLGHTNQKETIERMYKPFHLDWSHVEQLIEWIQLGSWKEIRNQRNSSQHEK